MSNNRNPQGHSSRTSRQPAAKPVSNLDAIFDTNKKLNPETVFKTASKREQNRKMVEKYKLEIQDWDLTIEIIIGAIEEKLKILNAVYDEDHDNRNVSAALDEANPWITDMDAKFEIATIGRREVVENKVNPVLGPLGFAFPVYTKELSALEAKEKKEADKVDKYSTKIRQVASAWKNKKMKLQGKRVGIESKPGRFGEV